MFCCKEKVWEENKKRSRGSCQRSLKWFLCFLIALGVPLRRRRRMRKKPSHVTVTQELFAGSHTGLGTLGLDPEFGLKVGLGDPFPALLVLWFSVHSPCLLHSSQELMHHWGFHKIRAEPLLWVGSPWLDPTELPQNFLVGMCLHGMTVMGMSLGSWNLVEQYSSSSHFSLLLHLAASVVFLQQASKLMRFLCLFKKTFYMGI